MTLFLADIASYQKNLSISQLRAAGFGGINVKVSHGLTQKSVHPNVSAYVREAREAGFALSCFHWLDATASGVAQADYAYRCMAELGLNVPGVAHVCDCESDATQGIYKDYVARMEQLLSRPVATYTGDWKWTWERPRWLWSAPAPGYQPSYPGDSSPLWDAEGWRLDVMQYRVSPIGGINVSQSAVRDLELWQEMIGLATVYSVPASTTLRDEFNAVAPGRDKTSDGTIGDPAHAESVSDHNLDETGNTGGVEDNDDIDEVHARDVDSSGPWPAGWTMERFVQLILARCRSGQERRLRYIIYNRRIWRKSNGWVQEVYTGPNPHDKHAHFSFEYGSGSGASNPENITTPYGIEAAMALTEAEFERIATEVVEKFWATPYGSESYPTRTARALARDLHAERDYAVGDGKGAAYANVKAGSFLDIVGKMAQQNAGQVAALLAAIEDDEVPIDPAAVALAILPALTAAIVAELPEGTLTEEQVQAASERGVRNVLRSGVDE